jgi:hypothetical protein
MTKRLSWEALTYWIGLLPLLLLWHGNAFYLDWNNHLWLIGYFGEYFRQHWAFPVTINSEQIVGMPFPVFYGILFYPAAGLISSFTGANIAIRLICTLVFLLQIRQVSQTVKIMSGDPFTTFAVTVLVSFATYPLTNLYNRTAIPEFIAASLILSVCMMWLRVVRMNDTLVRRRLIAGAALTLAMALGTHPITAILGGSVVGLIVLATLPFPHRSRSLWKTFGVAAALVFIVIAPWIYAVASYGSKIQIAGGGVSFLKRIDRFVTRFSPLPWDPRMGTPELQEMGTPYLEAQINFAMLLLAVYLLYRLLRQHEWKKLRELRIASAALACFGLVCVASLSDRFWLFIPKSLKFIQFAYRLVTYADLFLLLAVLFLLAAMRRISGSPDRPFTAVLAVCVMLSASSVFVKMLHAHRSEEPTILAGSEWHDTNRDALRSMPSSFYGSNGYAVKTGALAALPANPVVAVGRLPIGEKDHFGEVLPVPIFDNSSGLIRTNVQIFPWNRLVWNGREVPFADTAPNPDLLTVIFEKPGAGTLSYFLRPDPLWMGLRTLSLWVAALWAIAFAVWSISRPETKQVPTPRRRGS